MTSLSDLPRASGAGGGAPAAGEFVLLGMPDVNGSVRGKALRPDAFEAAVEGGAVMTDLLLALDPTDTPITDYERFGIRSGAGDLVVQPDLATLRELSWLPGWRICLCTPAWPDGSRCELSSRETLRGALEQIAAQGYETMAAFEYEVRLRDGDDAPLSSGLSYSLSEISRFERFVAQLVPALEALGVELSAVHTEAGPGLLELNLAAREGLRAADDAVFVKLAVREVAASMGLHASFLAKTKPGEEGSSGHVHLSCWADGVNAFGAGESDELPAPFSAAIAGVLEHLGAASLMLCPTINSYKRLVPGWFAPVNVSWGLENRSCAVRAIRGARPERWRIECRRPGADANPYLALAALAVSAADGMARGATPPAPIEGDASERTDLPALPGSLESALIAFDRDEGFRRLIGETFCDYYRTSRAWELAAWRESVSDWERERYERAV
ncbi:MAG TPA: glutamine synthetase family protein [Solirubrobacteraceae bacterium]|nr:glutamine synthetase family protein [Solirubrobacteraceae bacterium]